MSRRPSALARVLLGVLAGTAGTPRVAQPQAGTAPAPAPAAAEPQLIDLPTALRLAGAENLDVMIARQQLAEAEAADSAAKMQFLPWLQPAAGVRRHDNRIQDVVGNMLDADKHSYTVGLAVTWQVELGDAIYRKQAAQQGVQAATAAVAAQEGDAVLAAATSYFELVRARAFADTVREAARISGEYEGRSGAPSRSASRTRATSSACASRRSATRSSCGARSSSSAWRRAAWPKCFTSIPPSSCGRWTKPRWR